MSTLPSSNKLRGSRVVSGKTRIDTLGAWCSKRCAKPPISSAAVASAMANTNELRASRGTKCCGTKADCSWSNAARTLGQSASAKGVGVMPCPSRLTKSSPKVSRNRRKALLTAGWVMDKLRAALVRLFSAMTSSNTLSKFRSRVRKLVWIASIISIVNDKHHEYKVEQY